MDNIKLKNKYFDTAGIFDSAVGKTQNEINSQLFQLIASNGMGLDSVTFSEGYYLTPADGASVQYQSNENFVYAKIAVTAGDKITMNVTGLSGYSRSYVFVDSNGNAKGRCAANLSGERVVEAPEGAVYIYINNNIVSQPTGYYAFKGKKTDTDYTVENVFYIVDGYDSRNNTSVNPDRLPVMFPFTQGDAYVKYIKLKVKTAGSLSIGVYHDDISANPTYDSTKYTLISSIAIENTGEQIIQLDTPIPFVIGESIAIGQSTDTCTFAYGGNGDKGFWMVVDGTITHYTSASCGITIAAATKASGKSTLAGKKVSIFGDSMSTFAGAIPAGNQTFYTGNNAGVHSVSDTWWWKTIDALGLELVVNNSWSGRAVSSIRDGESGHSTDAGYKEANVLALKTATESPDIIIVKLGHNDFNHGASLGNYDGSTALPTDPTTFLDAYAIMLDLIMRTYPLARVYCCTMGMCEYYIGNVGFPELNENNETISEWNEALRKLVRSFGAFVLETESTGITAYNLNYYMGDYKPETGLGLHPNAAGHSLIANEVIKQLDGTIKKRY